MARARLASAAIAPRTVVIVCGYDLDSDLASYVRAATLRFIGVRVDAVIFSGGRTSPTTCSSEAEAMSAHYAQWAIDEQVLLDNEAMTTLDNIVFAKRLAGEQLGAVDRYLVCCDVAHLAKAWLLSRIVLGRRIRMLPVHRRVPLWIWLREPFSIAIESLGAVVPRIRPWLSFAAARMKGVSPPAQRTMRQPVS